eukprot:323873_1
MLYKRSITQKINIPISNEFYYFLMILAIWNIYIWFFTLEHVDERILPLRSESINKMSLSEFENTVSEISPHFAEFERICRNDHLNYTLDLYSFVASVLVMDWTFRIIYLFIFYRIVLYIESKYALVKCNLNLSNKIIITSNNRKNKIINRIILFTINTILFFILNMIDIIYTRSKYVNNENNVLELKDYSHFSIFEQIKNVVFIYIRVHPSDAWLIQISHGIAYPFTLYAITRSNISSFIYCRLLTIIFGIFHFPSLFHVLDNRDMQLRCVRRMFIWSTRASSIQFESVRQTVAPYLNVICLTFDCKKFIF